MSSLSLQSHNYRSEHWVVVQGTAEVNIDGKIEILGEGQSTYVPLGSTSANKSIKIADDPNRSANHLPRREDITRYEDIYNRK